MARFRKRVWSCTTDILPRPGLGSWPHGFQKLCTYNHHKTRSNCNCGSNSVDHSVVQGGPSARIVGLGWADLPVQMCTTVYSGYQIPIQDPGIALIRRRAVHSARVQEPQEARALLRLLRAGHPPHRELAVALPGGAVARGAQLQR